MPRVWMAECAQPKVDLSKLDNEMQQGVEGDNLTNKLSIMMLKIAIGS